MLIDLRVILSGACALAALVGCKKREEEPASAAATGTAAAPAAPLDAVAVQVDAPPEVPDAAEIDAAAKPTFINPASEQVYDRVQAALAELTARGEKHARYFEDCRSVWNDTEASVIMAEKDPVVVGVIDALAAFCLRDLALQIAANRMEVISTMEDALEKKVGKFTQNGWDRVCGEPIEMIQKAEKRYAEDVRFTNLSKPIVKRCG
ncbi:MAG TPA: hypothetical protein VK427_08675, partial [Kofleriaceae bacterium]|nr:hypothetical protein [Kofleriaceae bacterium]